MSKIKQAMQGKDALIELLQGNMVVAFDRYYRIDGNTLQYSDNKREWKESRVSVNDFMRPGVIPVYQVVK